MNAASVSTHTQTQKILTTSVINPLGEYRFLMFIYVANLICSDFSYQENSACSHRDFVKTYFKNLY